MAMSLGIDFGTTHTVVAFADRGNYPLVSFELDTGEALDTFPSVVAARDGELRFGLDALAVAGEPSWTQARSFKRLLARQSLRAGGTLALGGRDVALPELLTGFLTSLERALRTRSNLPAQLKKASRLEAVVASPANAFCTQRFMTLEAFRAAGFTVRAMLNEPSAAGFEYAHRHARTLTSKREHVLVYDLGGGTFDASLVLMTGVRHDVVQTAGLAELGGDDFDDVLVQLVAKAAKLDLATLTPWFRGRLTEACRTAKEQLTPNTRRLTIDLEGCLSDRAPVPDVTIAAADYALACQPLVDRTIAAMQPLLRRLPEDAESGARSSRAESDRSSRAESDRSSRAESDRSSRAESDRSSRAESRDETSRAEPRDDLAGIYVVGGGSELPIVARTLKEAFGRRVHRSPHPHGAVAIGLAIASDQALRFELTDRFSRHFGVFREAEGGRAATYDTIFGRETELPRPGQGPLEAVRRYRAAHNLGHFRFFECAGFDARGYPQGDIAPMSTVRFPFEAALRDQPLDTVAVRRLEGEGPRVTERYTVDEQGLVEVSITNEDAGFTTRHQLGGQR